MRGLPIDAEQQVHLSISDVLNAYTLLGGLATCALFLFYGAVFIALKTAGPVRDDAFRFARALSVPAIVLAGGFGLWTQLAYGKGWTWLALAVAVVALLTAVALMWAGTPRRLGLRLHHAWWSPRWWCCCSARCTRTCCRRRSTRTGA